MRGGTYIQDNEVFKKTKKRIKEKEKEKKNCI